MTPALLTADEQELARFANALLRHATPGTILSLRAFEEGASQTHRIEPIAVPAEGLAPVVTAAARLATEAARAAVPVVFAPPLATFRHAPGVETWRARSQDLAEGLALSVECDAGPTAARMRLEAVLGTATVVVASGGIAIDPETGEIEPRLHLHWRLAQPTRSAADHARLRQVRALATRLVGGDASNIPLVHPIRWPGSWHRKADPKLARILALTADAEIDLGEALERLSEAAAAKGVVAPATAPQPADGAQQFKFDCGRPTQGATADPRDVAAALAVIPNGDLDWEAWNRVGLATWAATQGSADGHAAFTAWSAKSAKFDATTTDDRWAHYHTSPPNRIGAGTLFHLAAQTMPGWRKPSLASGTSTIPPITADTTAPSEDEDMDDTAAPVDLWATFAPPDLSIGVLPEVIEAWATAKADLMGTDPGGLAMAALTVAAAALTDRICVQVKVHDPSWREPARIWTALVGEPSTRKSPILSAAAAPLLAIDGDLFRRFLSARAAYDQLGPDERKATQAPRHCRKRLEDTTIEAAREVLKDSPDGLLVLQDELSGWFGGMDKYTGNQGAARDRAFWLQSFNGGEYALTRISRGAALIPNLSVCVLGGIQPDPLRRIVNDAVDDGLIQRLFPIVLRPASFGRDVPMPTRVVDAYHEAIRGLHQMQPPEADHSFGAAMPLRFDAGAQEIRRGLEQTHHALIGCEAVNRKLAAHVGKLDGLFARLCVLFHCLDHHAHSAPPAIIPEAVAARVSGFMRRFLLPHAVAFYGGVLSLSDDHDRLTAVAGHILARRLDEVTCRVVERGDRTMRALDRPAVLRVLHQFEALGWLVPKIGLKPGAAQRWTVNPQVHRCFAERAATESARRRTARAAVASMVGGGAPD